MAFVHLHTHAEYSPLDGLSTIPQIVEMAAADNQPAVALTDHGTCAGHPSLARATEGTDIKPIFGIEAYFVDDRTRRSLPKPEYTDQPDGVFEQAVAEWEAESKRRRDYYHLVLWAKSDEGLRNIYAMTTESHRTGMYYKPRIDWQLLEKHREGVMASTACLRGPIAHPLLRYQDEQKAVSNLGRLLNIFGDDLFLEIHANGMEEQVAINQITADLGHRYGVPLIAVSDSHFPSKEWHDKHQAWIAVQTNTDVQDETDLFAHSHNLYMQTGQEVRDVLGGHLSSAVVDECISNTVVVADRAGGGLAPSKNTPIYSKVGGHKRDADRLLDLCMGVWDERVGHKRYPQSVAMARFDKEFRLLVDKQFCGYFLYVWDYVKHAKDHRVLVGPGRGSGAGSMIAYLLAITEIDPVEADLLFERFMTEGRTSLPDFDVDFPTTKRDFMQNYVTGKYGEDHVIRVGTHLRLRNKGVVKDLFRALRSKIDVDPQEVFRDSDAISKIITEAEAGTAGLGLSWEELWVQEGDLLDPYKEKYPEVFSLAEYLVGRLKSYGKHAAGLVISTEAPLTGTLPLRGGEDGEQMVSQWEMPDLEAMGLVKYDFLTLRTLDTIQQCVDLIRVQQGIDIDPYKWTVEYDDHHVWEQIGLGHTLGDFQIETASGTRMCKDMRPANLSELSDVVTLVRPGPMRSGLTKTYLRRRAGDESVTVPDPRLDPVLSKTYGCLLYQEDIMATTMVLAGYDSNKADDVRKILGKKQVEKVAAAGKEFIDGAVANGMDAVAAAHLWAQMAEFAKYSFNRAHAWSYAVLAYWCAWFKYHYPVEFLVAALSTVDKDAIPAFINEARRLDFTVLPPDINESGQGFTGRDQTIRYGLDSIKGVGEAALEAITSEQPYTSWDDFKERCTVNSGVVRLLARVGAFDSLVPNRRGLEQVLEAEHTGASTQCVFKEDGFCGPNSLPCHFDWSSEPVQIGRSGKPLKGKPLPKKCTKACRQYTAPEPPKPEDFEPYSERDIREIERESLGVYLSSTPFKDISESMLRDCLNAEQLEASRPGLKVAAAIVTKVKTHKDRNGNTMAFLSLLAQTGEVDVVAFSSTYSEYKNVLQEGLLCVVGLDKKVRNGESSYILLQLVRPGPRD